MLNHMQLRAEWNTFLPGCIIFNSHSSKLNIIVTLIVDVMLLLTVLVGLLRWCSDGLGMFGIGRLLWKQVGYQSFPSAVMPSVHSYGFCSSVRKGVIWLLLATAAEVPPTVCPVSLLAHPRFANH